MISNNRKYSNENITVVWQSGLCTHATVCFTLLRTVFDPIKRPWVNMAGASTDEIIDVVEKCPTRALTFFWNDTKVNLKATSPKIFDGDLNLLFPTSDSPSKLQ